MASNKKVPGPSGFVKPGFEHVQDVFRQSIENGVERGGSFAAYYRGELVVSLWGGYADEESRRPWKHNTVTVFYSSTKSVAATVMAHLVQKGLLSYEQPVSNYWPQFAQNGKEKISLKQILSMTAGLAVLSSPFKLSLLRDDPVELERLLAEQKPWKAGDVAAYSPIVIGLYLDCIVKKVDPQKRGLAQYFYEEIAKPFGIDFFIGMPRSEYWRATRSVVTVRGKSYKAYQQKLSGKPIIDQQLLRATRSQPSDFYRNSIINNPEFLELPSPSSHGVGSAAGMAKLHGILANGGSTVDGRCLLSVDMIQKLQTPLFIGKEQMYGIDFFYSYGMELLPCLEAKQIHYSFGHGGFGGQYAAADPNYKIGWAYCTNYLDPTIMITGKTKWNALEHALFQCVHALEGVKVEHKLLDDCTEVQNVLQQQKAKL